MNNQQYADVMERLIAMVRRRRDDLETTTRHIHDVMKYQEAEDGTLDAFDSEAFEAYRAMGQMMTFMQQHLREGGKND